MKPNPADYTQDCLNCGHHFTGLYCPACGQKLRVVPFTMGFMVYSFFESNFSFEKGILRTIKGLAYKPGKVVNDYIKGITNPYYTPLKYVFVAASFSALLMIGTGLFDDTIATQATKPGLTEQQKDVSKRMMGFISNYMSLLSIVYLPFAAWISKLLFKKARYNFAEHLVFNSYILGQSTLYSMVLMLLIWAGLDGLRTYEGFTIAGALINMLVYIQFSISTFSYSWFQSLWRSVVTYILSYLLYISLLSTVVAVLAMNKLV